MKEHEATKTEPLLVKEHAKTVDGDIELAEVEEKQVKLFGGHIILNPTISKTNFYMMISLSVYKSLVWLPVGMLNGALLTYTYGLNLNQQKDLSLINTLIGLFVHLLVTPHFGALCDTYGRRKMLVIGIIVECITTVLLPTFPKGNFILLYFVVHTLQGIGSSSMNTPPLLADYIDFETKGRVAAIQSIIFNLGNYAAQMIQANTDPQQNLNLKFYVYGIIGLVLGLIISIFLKGGMYHKALYHDRKLEKAKKSLAPEYSKIFDEEDLLEEKKQEDAEKILYAKDDLIDIQEESDATEAKKKDLASKDDKENSPKNIDNDDQQNEPPITTVVNHDTSLNNDCIVKSRNSLKDSHLRSRRSSHASQALKPGIITGFKQCKNPWILIGFVLGFITQIKMAIKGGIIFNTYIAAMLGKDNATQETAGLHSNETLTTLICCVVLSFYADKFNKILTIWFALLSSLVATAFILIAPTVDSWFMYSSFVIWGISNAAFIVMNNQLISKYADPRYRASVSAANGLVQTIGSNFMGLFGVWISKYYNRFPFYMYLGIGSAGFVFYVVIYLAKRRFLNNI